AQPAFPIRFVNLAQNRLNIVLNLPVRIVAHEFAQVTDVPDMVAKAILIRVRPVQFTSSDALTKFNCLEHGAIAVGPSADVVYLARARLLIELVERANEIRAVNIVARLFAFVAEDGIRRAGCGTSLDTRGTRATACQNDWAPTNSRRGSRPYAFRNSMHVPALTNRPPTS